MTESEPTPRRAAERSLVVVSNRLPVAVETSATGGLNITPGSGGLVSALRPVLSARGGVWVGWPGTVDADQSSLEQLLDANADAGYRYRAVPVTVGEEAGFYSGFSNQIIWPLFHGMPGRCRFEPGYWDCYLQVNQKFAHAAAAAAGDDSHIWVHDYHLMTVSQCLKAQGLRQPVSFFLHIPFPPPASFQLLPWRVAILQALLAFDFIGFQTPRDRTNFLRCLREFCPGVSAQDYQVMLPPQAGDGSPPRRIGVGSFPISIDFQAFARRAASPDTKRWLCRLAQEIRARQVILGVDRLDYTKGLPEKLSGFRQALRRYPQLRRRLILIQFVIPSRETIPAYRDLHRQIERQVSEINGELSEPGWVPVHYYYRRLEPTELVAYYRAANIALITSLNDGMNLVTKEYCAAKIDNDGVLVLSEFAGAADALADGALLVNPVDSLGMADAIRRAFDMRTEERQTRMRWLRHQIESHDVFAWVDALLRAAGAERKQHWWHKRLGER